MDTTSLQRLLTEVAYHETELAEDIKLFELLPEEKKSSRYLQNRKEETIGCIRSVLVVFNKLFKAKQLENEEIPEEILEKYSDILQRYPQFE